MSLLPYIMDSYLRPTRLMDQQFGLVLDPEDLLSPIMDPSSCLRHSHHNPRLYIRPWKSVLSQRDSGSTVSLQKDRFEANLDVQQFKPEEITVKAVGNNMISIEGKHEEKEDEHGFISRQFVRRYVIPKDCDFSKIESRLSSDGVLTITAPRIKKDDETEYKNIPITQTGKPLKVEQNEKIEENGEKKEN
ncbi:hypothetical protein WA026_006676 [Henosepilachna vigintioctopunctata]|uniref:SHSP domain-containing protein n=1 Tax=Henosepilachna vigintioctopunctata TaxID=420089 RepID=A0AAW1U7F4_9CUCU